MRIVCPNCETSYQLADGALGATGRKVRCARCGTVWHAAAADPAPAGEASDEDWKEALTGADAAPGAESAGGDDEGGAPDGGLPALTGTAAARDRERSPAEGRTIDMPPAGFEPEKRSASVGAARRGGGAGRGFSPRIGVPVTILAAVIGLVVFGIAGRQTVVRAFPDFASLYELVGLKVNLRGMTFSDVATHREMDGNTPILVVEGTISNLEMAPQPLAALRVTLKSSTGRDVYAWNHALPQTTIEGGGTLRFKTRLLAPPETAAFAEVRFTDKRAP